MTPIKNEVMNYISENGNSHILIHSDVLFGFKIKFENQAQFLTQHCNELQEICQSLNILMPSFNYDFFKGKPYDVKNDVSQVGVLSEYFRNSKSSWRSPTPVFNFSGTGTNPLPNIVSEIDPFDDNSIFGFLYKNKGLLMHYGSAFNTTTLIHYVERISGILLYRYNKIFNGQIIDLKSQKHDAKLIYHVRPKDFSLDYDWLKIENDLLNLQLISKYKEGRTQIVLARIDKVVAFWLEKLNIDPFYFLDMETSLWVKTKHNELNRPFIITDFE